MTATPWVDCENRLILGPDGKPYLCETDPCAETDTPVDNFCARSFASDWDGDELSPLAVTIGHSGTNKGIGFSPPGGLGPDCSCDLMESTWILPYDAAQVDRAGTGGTIVGHAWSELFDLPCENADYRVSYLVSAYITGGFGASCRLNICTWPFVTSSAGVPRQITSRGAYVQERFAYTESGGGPVDLTSSVEPVVVGLGFYCPTPHPLWNGTSTPYEAGTANQYCNWNRLPKAWAVLT